MEQQDMTQCLPLPQGSRPGRREGAGTGAGGRRRPGQGRGIRREGGNTWSKGGGRSFNMRNKVEGCPRVPALLAPALLLGQGPESATV